MKYGPLWFSVVPHKDRAFARHLELSPFPSDFILSYLQSPFLRADEDIGRSREVVDLFTSNTVKLTCVLFQVHYKRAFPLGIYDYPNGIYFCIVPFF